MENPFAPRPRVKRVAGETTYLSMRRTLGVRCLGQAVLGGMGSGSGSRLANVDDDDQ
jgi:hypothetical protein